MEEEKISIPIENIEVVDVSEYTEDLTECFDNVPDVARSLVKSARDTFFRIEQMLYSIPAFVNMVKANIPEQAFQAILTEDQKKNIANGALKLMTKKDGSLLANLVDPKTNKIVSSVPLQSVNLSPELSQAMTNYASQMQMAQIAEQIQVIRLAVEEVRQGQEYDRLASAYSCQQKLLQAMEIKNPELKSIALLKIASDAEDSRNLLMQSQDANLAFIRNEPETIVGKILSGSTAEKVKQRINEVRESLNAVNMVSLVEAMAYQELEEPAAARQSLYYYACYIEKSYLSVDGLVERLDSVDPLPENYWSRILPDIKEKIQALPYMIDTDLLQEGDNNE